MNKRKNSEIKYYNLDDFFEQGCFLKYKIGSIIDDFFLSLVVEKSNSLNNLGYSELYLIEHKGVIITVGINDFNSISFFMIRIPKYNEKIIFKYQNFDLSNKNIHEILSFLNKNNIYWEFGDSIGKIIKIGLDNIEVIFSYELNEYGIYAFQTPSSTKGSIET